jgi:tRNA threonylcarbamoyladenosine biosynthesis protein TsaB
MKILAIETSTPQLSVVLNFDGDLIGGIKIGQLSKQVEILIPSIQKLLDSVLIDIKYIQGIAVDVGPGLFTGIRTGIATAMAISKSLNIKILPVSSLEVLAVQANSLFGDIVVPIVDARRDEVYYSVYDRSNNGLNELSLPISKSVDDFISDLEKVDYLDGRTVTFVGSGVNRYFERLCKLNLNNHRFKAKVIKNDYFNFPSAEVLAEIAQVSPKDNFVLPNELKPNYVRSPNVIIGWETRS